MEPYILPHRISDCKVAFEEDLIENGNWKFTMENNRECYHCPPVHPLLNKLTPYVSLSGRKVDSVTSFTSPVPQLNAAINGIAGSATVTKLIADNTDNTTAFGVRWEAGKSYAVKAEFANIAIPKGSSGGLSGVAGGKFESDTSVNVVSVAVDFVF